MKLFFDFILIDNKLLISCYHEITSLVASHRSLATQIMIQYNLEKLNFKAQNLSSVTVNGSDEKDIENKFTEILNNIKDKFTYDTFFLGADLNLGLDSKKPAGFLFQEQKIRKIFADKKGLKIYCIFSSSNRQTLEECFDFVDEKWPYSMNKGFDLVSKIGLEGVLIRHKTSDLEVLPQIYGNFPFPNITNRSKTINTLISATNKELKRGQELKQQFYAETGNLVKLINKMAINKINLESITTDPEESKLSF